MKEEIFGYHKVNPKWYQEHTITLLNRIYDIINDKAKEGIGRISEEEMLIQALIEFEWYRYDAEDEDGEGDVVRRSKNRIGSPRRGRRKER